MVREVSFGEAIKLGFRKYFDFKGRAQRAEYWWWTLFVVIASIVLAILDGIFFGSGVTDPEPLGNIFSLATFIPGLAVAWRRMHDIDKSGWWNFLALVPVVLTVSAFYPLLSGRSMDDLGGGALTLIIIGTLATLVAAIYVLVLLVRDSDRGTNRYGPSPKYGSEMTVFD